jgi:multiple sugar transport system substrate-binding protein
MKISRTVSMAAVVSMGVIGLSAFGGGVPDRRAPEGGDGPTTITFWNNYTASDRPVVEALVERFNDSQDDVVVDMTIQPFDVLTDTLLPAYAAGEGPTVVALDASFAPSYADLGVIQAVDDVFDETNLTADVLPEASLEAVTVDGQLYGVPFGFTPMMLYWNRAVFEEAGVEGPPATMDEMAEAAVAIADPANELYGIALSDAANQWAQLMWANGGGVVSEDGSESIFGSPQSIEAVEFWSGLMIDEGISPVGLGGAEADALFGAGQAAMLINGPWVSAGVTEAGLDVGIAPVPAGDAAQMAVAISVNLYLNADASEEEKEAVYDFMEFWNSVETQTDWALGTGWPPTRSDVDPAALADNPTAQAFAQETNARFHLGGIVNATEIDNDVVVPTIQRITNGDGTAEELMPEAAEQIDALLEQ